MSVIRYPSSSPSTAAPSTRYANFFFRSHGNTVVEIDTVEISHPAFSKVYRLVRNVAAGLTATLEDGSIGKFDYYPMRIENNETAANLDQTMTVTFGDLGKIIPFEIDNARNALAMNVYPLMTFRVYRSDDLSGPMEGPIIYEVTDIPRTKTGATLHVAARRLNQNSTGEVYDLNRFQGLRAV